jgi:hypothetical protein
MTGRVLCARNCLDLGCEGKIVLPKEASFFRPSVKIQGKPQAQVRPDLLFGDLAICGELDMVGKGLIPG